MSRDEFLSRLWELAFAIDDQAYAPDQRSGFFSSDPQIETEALLWLADSAITRLYQIATKSPAVANRFARKRVNWPAMVSLSSRIESKYHELLGTFNKAGENTKAGKLFLGAELPFQVNRKTKPGPIYNVATWVVRLLHNRADWRFSIVLISHYPRLEKLRREKLHKAEDEFLKSIGVFCHDNWAAWRPIVESCLDFFFGPYSLRWEMLPVSDRKNFYIAWKVGCSEQWIVEYGEKQLGQKKAFLLRTELHAKKPECSPPLCDSTDIAEFQRAMGNAKSQSARWTNLKSELVKKVRSLCPQF